MFLPQLVQAMLTIMSCRVVLLPLQYDKADALCKGIILVLAGPGTFRRIALFEHLPRAAIDDIIEQDITIV